MGGENMTKYLYRIQFEEAEDTYIEAECGPQAEDMAYEMLRNGNINFIATAIPVFTKEEA
jgi:hypothetical protein